MKIMNSFDLSFLILTNKLDSILRDKADVIFYGPEARLLGEVFVKSFRKNASASLKKLRSAFNLKGDITVNTKKLKSAINSSKNFGEKIWKDVGDRVDEILTATGERAVGFYVKQSTKRKKKKVDKQDRKAGFSAFISESIKDHVKAYTESYPDRILHPEIERLAKIVQTSPQFRAIDKEMIKDRLLLMGQKGEEYFRGMSDVQVGRVWNYTGLELAHQNDVEEYMIVAQMDDPNKPCPECQVLHGQHFSVEKSREVMLDVLSQTDPDAIGEAAHFPSFAELTAPDMTQEKISQQGYDPPFHGSCYAEGTEVYTNEGWKLFENLKGNELFLSRNENGIIEWVKAIKYIEYHYTGEMIRLHHKWFDLLITPDHNQIFYTRNGSEDRKKIKGHLKSVTNMLTYAEYKIPRTAKWIGTGKCTKNLAKFLGYYLSEGSATKRSFRNGKWTYSISIAQSSKKHLDKIFNVCKSIKDIGEVHKGKDKIYIAGNDKLVKKLMEFGHSGNKYVPDLIKNADKEIIMEFLNAYIDGDGSRARSNWTEKNLKSERVTISTSSKKMADDIGELILKVGGYPSFTVTAKKGDAMTCPRTGKTYYINNDQIAISWNNTQYAQSNNLHVCKVNYDGIVRDVELEKNHVLWIKYRDKTCFSGNCRCETIFLWQSSAIVISEQEKVIEEISDKIRNLKHEELYAVDKLGNIKLHKAGSASEINLIRSEVDLMEDTVLVHNHPMGFSFSTDDINAAIAGNATEIKAISSKYDYSMVIDVTLYQSMKNINELKNVIYNESIKLKKEFREAIRNGKMTLEQAQSLHHHELWTRVTKNKDLHVKYERKAVK